MEHSNDSPPTWCGHDDFGSCGGNHRGAHVWQCFRFIVGSVRHIFRRSDQRHTKSQKHANQKHAKKNAAGLSHRGCPCAFCELCLSPQGGCCVSTSGNRSSERRENLHSYPILLLSGYSGAGNNDVAFALAIPKLGNVSRSGSGLIVVAKSPLHQR
jgi:hypothetical protein